MSKMTLREQRRAKRITRRRVQRITVGTILVLVIAAIAYLVYQDATKPELQIEDVTVGSGQEVSVGNLVSVHYTGWLEDGTKFDSSLDRDQPFDFVVGNRQVIQGWDDGLVGMKVGGVRRLIIPPHLAYGSSGYAGAIPPNATLTFEIELLEIR